MAWRELRGKSEGRTDVGLFEIGKVLEQLFDCAASRDGLNHYPNSHANTTDARLASYHFGIDCDALDTLHVHIVAQIMPRTGGGDSERISSALWLLT